MNTLFFNYPSWIHPSIFPGVPFLENIRWYGLMYVFAFGTAFFILKKVWKEGFLDSKNPDGTLRKASEDDIFGFIATGIVFLLIGARVLSALYYTDYDPTDPNSINYWAKPWLIFWPFNANGKFTGLAGMSFHGGFIGGLIGMIVWCLWHKRPILKWVDAMVVAIPLGYTFGRLGNFLNGELCGRVTTSPIGVLFPRAERIPQTESWVKEFAAKINLNLPNELYVNLPRHPSQLYEAFFEGIVLFLIIWFLHKKRPFDGFLAAVYTTGYGLFRFIIEYFRQPDANKGYIFGDKTGNIYEFTSITNISAGQTFCFIMIIGGIALGVGSWLYHKHNLKKSNPED